MGFSEMVVPASYAPIFCIVFESCPFPRRDGQIPPRGGGGGIPPRLGTTALGIWAVLCLVEVQMLQRYKCYTTFGVYVVLALI